MLEAENHGAKLPAADRLCQADYLLLPVSPHPVAAITAFLLTLTGPGFGSAHAQSLPAFMPVNPVAASRSGVYFQPYHLPRPGGWHAGLSLDYASAIELNNRPGATYVLDSEILRVRLRLERDLDPSAFLLADAEVGGAYAGFMDGLLDWYHRTIGLAVREREERPDNRFLYGITLPNGDSYIRSPSDLFLGDARVGLGYRFDKSFQTVMSVTLPTSTAPRGYGRGVMSISVLNTARFNPAPRLVLEGSLGIGFTPTHGELAPMERESFVSLSVGGRVRFWGRQSLYANLFYHSPYYHDTTFPGLDQRELSIDFGWLLSTGAGTDWRIGLTEDLEPGGPAVDLIFRLGRDF
jgi:uncharacterized protein DUF3187